jgi:hypothetical protein
VLAERKDMKSRQGIPHFRITGKRQKICYVLHSVVKFAVPPVAGASHKKFDGPENLCGCRRV